MRQERNNICKESNRVISGLGYLPKTEKFTSKETKMTTLQSTVDSQNGILNSKGHPRCDINFNQKPVVVTVTINSKK